MGRRQLLRIDAKIVVEFQTADQFFEEYATNISNGGMFINSRDSLPVQTVLEITLKLPGLEEGIKVIGEVVHVIEGQAADDNNWKAGMGIHFVDYEETAKNEIEKYVQKTRKSKPQKQGQDRRKESRLSIRLRVKFPSQEVLQHDFADDISRGGIFIQTEKPRAVGDRFILTLVHPDTGQELEFKGEVVHLAKRDHKVPGSINGMGLKFLEMNEKTRVAIQCFLQTDLPNNQ